MVPGQWDNVAEAAAGQELTFASGGFREVLLLDVEQGK